VQQLIISIIIFMSLSARAFDLDELLSSRLDPSPEYLTIETETFRIHYPKKLESVAFHIATKIEPIKQRLERRIGWNHEGKTNIVVYPKSDDPGIFTFVYPHRQVFYDVALPPMDKGLNDYADWHEWLLTHELTHISHLEARAGPLARLFGSWMRPNSIMPAWAKEGLAVFIETDLTTTGRGKGSYYSMLIRKAVHERTLESPSFFSKDTVASFDNKLWPWTVRPYAAGYFLIRELAEMNGGELKSFSEESEMDFEVLWTRTLNRLKSEAAREISQITETKTTKLRYLTNTGYIYSGLTISPDGKVLLGTRDRPEVENSLIRFDLDGDRWTSYEEVISRSTGYQSSFSKSSRFLAFDQISRENSFYLTSDLYIYDFKEKNLVAGSLGLHARDVDVHPDGVHLIFVQNHDGKNRLLESDTAFENLTEIVSPLGFQRLSGPRYSPKGSKIIFTLHNEKTGGEDLMLIENQQLYKVLSDGHQNTSPVWIDDVQVMFSSDRTGVANIFVADLSKKTLMQVSHVIGGLYYPAPHPDKKWIYVASYRSKGFDVARFRWNSKTWKAAGRLTLEQAELPDPASTGKFSSKTYSSWPDMGPQYLRPSILLQPYTQQYGFIVGATDPLFFSSYDLDLRYDVATELPVGRFNYYYGGWHAPLDLFVTHDASVPASRSTGLSTWTSEVSLNIPFWDYYFLRPGLSGISTFSGQASPYVGYHLGIRYETRFKEIGQSFHESGSYFDIDYKQLYSSDGSSKKSQSITGTAETHLPLSTNRQVLHLKFQAGGALPGDQGPNSFFTMGGKESFPYSLGSRFTLYGFEPNYFFATGVSVATAVYTFSIKDIQRGIGTWPIYFGRLSGGLRGQVGSVHYGGEPLMPASGGVELYQDLVLTHVMDFSARLGLYQGTKEQGGETLLLFSLMSEAGI
jgi:hypothetical protein